MQYLCAVSKVIIEGDWRWNFSLRAVIRPEEIHEERSYRSRRKLRSQPQG